MSQEPGPADDQQQDDDTSHALPEPDPSSTPEQEIAIEQAFVDRVYDRVDILRGEALGNRDSGYAHLAATVPGAQYERDVFVYRAARRIADLDSQHEGLVFGRLDFDNGKARHIGRLGVRDEEYRTLLVDWRAPAAAPFYRATAVDRQDVARRRVIRSFGRRVEEISDDLLNEDAAERLPVIGDGALMAALGRKRTGRMRDIVATIQAEQDAAIRAPGRGATIITGGPGTGKTVVALHRAAYLLYQDRNRYEAAGILVVGPSAVFMKYIGRVLPSLGEETAALYSLGELYAGVEATRQDRPEVAAVKGGTVMLPILRRLVRQTPPGAPTELRIVYRGDVFTLDAAELAVARARVFEKETRPNLAKTEAGRALLVALWRKVKAVIEDAEPAKFSRDVGSRGEFLTFLDHWWPDLDPADVLGWAGDVRRLASAAEGHLKRGAIEAVAASLRESDFSIPDVALLDELRMLLGVKPQPRGRDRIRSWDGIQEVSTTQDRYYDRPERQARDAFYEDYAHVIVDEAQDLSPMQWRMLGRRGRAAGWTIVGDEAQSSWPRPKESAESRRRAVPHGRIYEFHLTKNYRNSKEVFDYAAEWAKPRLRDIDLPEAVRETGAAVAEKTVAADALLPEVAGAVVEALEAVEGTVGIIAPYDRHDELRGIVHDGRVTLVGPLESKGLEWDAVIAVDLESVAETHGPGVAYVVLTRSTQRLTRIDLA
ncbi:AAA family ATPase [Glycomyces sp. TRM65418]|uniref:HelD family protein n=1 Tax=Glycomyces sp. TRM65418 TaxID=2867006 RepID=UPI001CE55BA4|nr:UvrD-helicase domain-containing protein [Glycomyces sp. TRM65418]MCC3762942.1 AAA family ATPase [Glycomyces sp. TRM65418]QZD56966.1 AAA family ATPase [Glycomyces sp. TRM65418]